MTMLLEIVLGAAGSLALIAFARWRGPEREFTVYAVGLVVAALIYLLFAIPDGGSAGLGVEIAGVAGFALLAFLGIRHSGRFLALGWAIHVAWDVLLHSGDRSGGVPAWYPTLCIGFDLLLAVYIGVSIWKRDPWRLKL